MPQADIERLNAYFPREDRNLFLWGFICFSRQDYARVVRIEGVDKIMLGVECIEGGCLGELAIHWYMLGGKPVPRLEVYDDAWPPLHQPKMDRGKSGAESGPSTASSGTSMTARKTS